MCILDKIKIIMDRNVCKISRIFLIYILEISKIYIEQNFRFIYRKFPAYILNKIQHK